MNNVPEQNTSEWLEWRKDKIGASDAPIILGKSPWKSPYQLYEEKIGLNQNFYENDAMARGKALEPYALDEISKELGMTLLPKVFVHPKYEYIIASLDGVSCDGKIAVEIKCPGVKSHVEALQGKIPSHYQIQMQHQMEVLGLDCIYYYSFDGEAGVTLKLQRDQKLIEDMLEMEHEFYECLRSKTPPKDKNLRLDEEWTKWTNLWKELQEEAFKIEKQKQECKQRLIELTEGKNAYGNGVKLIEIERKGTIDYSKIPVLKTIDLEKYRKASSKYWSLA